jgi:pimeloyl-ACP methyl ester carboxylesterase
MRNNALLRSAACCLSATLLLAVGTSGDAFAQGKPPAHAANKRPLVLKEQGSFFVGGELVFSEYNQGGGAPASFGPGTIARNHAYVEYQIPQKQKYKLPIIMLHGGGHSGKTYETTPDGREGWFTSFTRRGFAPYVVDAPNRGRSGYEATQINKVRLGLDDPITVPLIAQGAPMESFWPLFRFGPENTVPYPGGLFPYEAIDQYVRQLIIQYRDLSVEPQKQIDAYVALIDRICPCILMTHSQSGTPGRQAAVMRPNLVKAIVAVEGGAAFPEGSPEEATLASIPLLQVEGDLMTDAQKNERKAITERLASLGGDAMTIVLPEIGIHGNTHMLMMDKNNEQVADVIEAWIDEHVGKQKVAKK